MTTESNTNQTTSPGSDNKAVFGPLGKYAIIAVIMVSIIVTTAVMLDRQMSSVDEHIAAIETEVAGMHKNSVPDSEPDVLTIEAEVVKVEPETEASRVIVEASSATETNAASDTEVTVVETSGPQEDVQINKVASVESNVVETPVPAADFSMQDQSSDRWNQIEQERHARIEKLKQENKQQISKVFARIKALESQQLEQYKVSKDKQVVQLREQLAQQQKVIEALILRNNDMYELRSANIQRNQSIREKILNRI